MKPAGPINVAYFEAGDPQSAATTRIVGQGEMARLVRAYNWTSTSLGPVDHWSKERVAIVNLILSCPTPARTLWGPDLVLIFNDSYRSIPGRRHPDAIGKPAREVFKEEWHVVGPLLDHAYATGETFYFDKRRLPIDTGEGVRDFYLDCTYSPIYESGKVAGLLGLFHDVTSEVNTARNLEARLNAICSTRLESIALLTPEGVVIDCNRASLEFAGNTRGDIVGRHFADAPWLAGAPDAPELIHGAIARANSGETFHSALSLVRPGGETMAFDFSLNPVQDASGAVVFLVSEARDITDVKRMESALLKSEQLAAVGRLASSIAHEINNPLESVMNLVYLARNANAADADRYLDLADQEIRRVSIIANQTLRFHKQASSRRPSPWPICSQP